jgi:hypothetical protein
MTFASGVPWPAEHGPGPDIQAEGQNRLNDRPSTVQAMCLPLGRTWSQSPEVDQNLGRLIPSA